jgi:alkylation response protein AidB-like acyl-CoA dehydrogenase
VQRTIFNEEQESFRLAVREFLKREVVPEFDSWEERGAAPREFYYRAAAMGLTGMQIPEEYGGGGADSFKYNAIVTEESIFADVSLGSLRIHTDLVLPYVLRYANDEQKARWLPAMAQGEMMTAIAMTEPGTGSDLTGIKSSAVRDGDSYLLNGAKTFISGGYNADRVLVVCRTSPFDSARKREGLSILVVDSKSEGFTVGRLIKKIGQKSHDTVELAFSDVRVPAEDLLGEEGHAFEYLTHNLPQERLTIAVTAYAAAAQAVRVAREYVAQRTVFGKPVAHFQNTKFVLAECATEVLAAESLLDRALDAHDRGELTPADAAAVKLYLTEVQGRVVDRCLQLHGGYGYTQEYPISRLYADARVSRIYGGTSEVMKTIIARDMGM